MDVLQRELADDVAELVPDDATLEQRPIGWLNRTHAEGPNLGLATISPRSPLPACHIPLP